MKVIIINTIDGNLHGIDETTGHKLWTIQQSPMVKVTDTLHSNPTKDVDVPKDIFQDSQPINSIADGVFIPQLTRGVGELYYYENGHELKKLKIPLKEIINDHSVYIDNEFVFTGKKIMTVLAIDPFTGQVLQTYGEDGLNIQETNKDLLEKAVFIGRTQYYLNVWDKHSSKLRYNITYGEFIPQKDKIEKTSKHPQSLAKEKPIDLEIISDVQGNAILHHQKRKDIQLKLGSPLVSAMRVDSDNNGHHVVKSYPFAPTNESKDLVYVGEVEGTVFLLPGSQFPLKSQFGPEKSLSNSLSKCEIGSPIFPGCMVGMYRLPAINNSASSDFGTFWGIFAFSVTIGILISYFWLKVFNKPKITQAKKAEENGLENKITEPLKTEPLVGNSNGLHALQLTEKILGLGSHGTVVYHGFFEGRAVAIKRLLIEFYDIADHEVKLLRESDVHPNVIRYYYKELSQGFMYLALELCPASLYDIIEKCDTEELREFRTKLIPKQAIFQIFSGVSHLHDLQIVHRDIKPQNILMIEHTNRKKPNESSLRFLISDFGLGKKLDEEISSFHVSHATAGGTQGWRAPECIAAVNSFVPLPLDPLEFIRLKSSRITKSIDVFSVGCVMYYILTNGLHPYGQKYCRETNILKGIMKLEGLDNVHDGVLARDLIKKMIALNSTKRPEISEALLHPYFWTSSVRLSFLQDVSDRLEGEDKDTSELLKLLEKKSQKVLKPVNGSTDWFTIIDSGLLSNLGKYRKYDGASVQDLLRVIRNKKHHYAELPLDVQERIGELPDGYLDYFDKLFPNLMTVVYQFVYDSSFLTEEPIFKHYFQANDHQKTFLKRC